MKKSILKSDISPKCEYCELGIKTSSGKEVLCRRMGVMQPDSYCKKFKYDPLKRVPKTAELPSGYNAEDFSI